MIGTAPPATRSVNDVTVLVATLGGAYVVSMFLRNSIGVIAPNLADDLALTPRSRSSPAFSFSPSSRRKFRSG
jgi:hypothetical protein